MSVDFVFTTYLFQESDGEVTTIQVQLSKEIAANLSVSISGGKTTVSNKLLCYFSHNNYSLGPGSQPSSVVVSGVQYSTTVDFLPGTRAFMPVEISSFMIRDDEVGLESTEEYQLRFIDSSEIVTLGPATTIRIVDEDG